MVSKWTLETLELYFIEKITSLSKLMDQRHKDYEKALDVALHSMDKRLEGMNEFRQTISDQRLADERSRAVVENAFITKEIYGLEQRNLENIVSKNSERIIEIDKKLFALSELKVDKREGLSTKYMTSVMMFAALGFIVSVGGIILSFLRH